MSNNAMSDETNLDWLARNVHVWKSGYDLAVVQRGGGEIYVTWPSVCSSGITKKQWLARRAELQNKPAKWPIGANWLAQDKDGEWYFYKDAADNPPQNHGEENWFSDEAGDIRCRRIGEVLGDWRDTLELRPDMYKSEPKIDTSAEHVQKTAESMRDWHERGELPPVGVVCEACLDRPPQWIEAEIVAHKDGFAIGWCKSVMKGCHGDKAREFRPIRTERDKLVELIKTYRHTFRSDTEFADAILSAGFKRGAA